MQSNTMTKESKEDSNFTQKLKRAVNTGDLVTFKRLVKGGVNVNSKFWYNSTLLHEAVGLGNVEIVKILLQNKADVNATNSDGRTALHIAARAGFEEIVSLLLKHGAEVDAQTLDGQTALHLAVWRDRGAIVQRLVNAGANVDLRDRDSWTPLFWAAKLNYMSMVVSFVEKGADLDCRNQSGNFPLIQSIRNGHLQLARFFILNGADYYLKANGESVIAALINNVHLSPDEIMDTVSLLISAGYDIQKDIWLKKNSFSKRFTEHNDFLNWLKKSQGAVQPLSCLCRTKIRSCFKTRVKGKRITELPPLLPLPQILIDFLLIDK